MIHQEHFSAAIDEAAALLDQLYQLLQAERQSLATTDADKTQEILQQKTELLQQLQQSSEQRSQLLTARGFSADEAGVHAFFATLPQPESKTLATQWQALQQKLLACREENLINGKVIHRSRRQIESLLDTLRGKDSHQRIYTGSGEAKSVNAGQPRAKA